MATYTTLRNGSRGDDVKKLQESLKAAGYNIGSAGADGIYGNQTSAAVKAYQQANGLSVDGIAGNQTLGKLYGGSTPVATTAPSAPTTPTTTPAVSPTQYKESEGVTNKRADLEALLNNKPDEYKSSYEDMIAQITDKIMNREKFSYDLNGDALYQQYKDQFINQGKLATQDTIGQAAAMTGGYGNSYAQSVGQQTYQGYLQQLNDKVPELYQLALNQYNQEGEDMYKQFGLLADREETEYGRHRDEVADWNTDRGFYADELHRAEDLDYTKYRDTVADSQWNAQFNESVRQFEQEYKLKVEEIEEAKRHNRITEDQAQQQIDLAKAELDQKKSAAAQDYAYKMAKLQADQEAAAKDSDFEKYTYAGLTEDGESKFYRDGKEYTYETGVNPYTGTKNPDAKNGTFNNGYQPNNVNGKKLSKTGITDEVNGVTQNVWKDTSGQKWIWDGTQNKYLKYVD